MKNIRLNQLAICSILALMGFVGCKKNDTTILEETRVVLKVNPMADWVDEVPLKQLFTINADVNDSFTTMRGAKFVFAANAFKDKNGMVVTGNVAISITEYNNYKDMLFSGVTVTSGNELLESGGMFYITATQNGNALIIDQVGGLRMSIPKTNLGEEPMQFWKGEKNIKDSFNRVNWVKQDTVKVIREEDSVDQNYLLNFDYFQFGYCNIDREAFSGIAKVTKFRIKLPDGCVDSNSTALLMFKEYNACAWCYWLNNEKLLGTYYNLPVGKIAKVLIYKKTGKSENDIAYAIKEITFEGTTNVEFSELTPCTKAQLGALIKGL